MFRKNLLTVLAICILSISGRSQQNSKSFTVSDEIGLAHFGNPYGGGIDPVVVSPNGAFVVAHVERGLVAKDRVQDELRIYRLEILNKLVNDGVGAQDVEPLWTIRRSTYKEGLIISSLRWLPDSSGVVFLGRLANGRNQLWLADVLKRRLLALTPGDQDVIDFDVKDATHYVYSVRTAGIAAGAQKAEADPSFDATGLNLYSPLLLPLNDPDLFKTSNRSELWAAEGGRPFPIRNAATGAPIPHYVTQLHSLHLSPDGNLIGTSLAVGQVPKDWESQYRPPPRSLSRLKAGPQDLSVARARRYISAYAIINARSGRVSRLTNAPDARSIGWGTSADMRWSDDGKALLLPSAYIAGGEPAPCIAIAIPSYNSAQCIQALKPYTEEILLSVQFAPGRTDRVFIESAATPLAPRRTRVLTSNQNGKWEVQEQAESPRTAPRHLDITVTQGLNDPPVLVARDRSTGNSRIVWDPNPQLAAINLGQAEIYRWKDDFGRDWIGGLYRPVDYIRGQRYPLVIQTHGFIESQFRPSGMFPTAFAARALAAKGIAVLQVRDCPIQDTPEEGPCQVRGYESAVKRLSEDGLIDPGRVGIIGFSRTCYYVMQALTTSKVHFTAASITDGVNAGYLQYLLNADFFQEVNQRDAESVVGARPFGPGLQLWLKNSPEFNVDKITTPLQIVARRGIGTLEMWEPYALLRALNKPVDLRVLNTYEHVLTNPKMRLASQGGTVDWFRFWLQGYEDPDPAKKDQYVRWRELRKMQEANEHDTPAMPQPVSH